MAIGLLSFYQKIAENHDEQPNHECLGQFLLFVGLF